MSTAYAATGIGDVLRRQRAIMPRPGFNAVKVGPPKHFEIMESPAFVEWWCSCNGMIRAATTYGPKSPQFKAARDRAFYGLPFNRPRKELMGIRTDII